MIMSGCQGKANSLSIEDRICPQCGHTVEVFSVDTQVQCEHCGFTVYNDKLSCVQWCAHAKSCVGPDVYEHLMKVAEAQKERREQEKREREAAEAIAV